VKHSSSRCGSKLPTVLISAAAGAGVGVFIARNFFLTEKKIRHRITTEFGAEDPEFIRTMSDFLGPTLLAGNRLTLLNNGMQIFPAMLAEIRAARHTITFENYDWEEGSLTGEFAEALAERGEAGVRVHFLQDAFGCVGLHGPSLNRLRGSPAELQIFRRLQFSRGNLRTHRKLLVIDGRVGFIGGAGIADCWLGDADQRHHWRDTHYRVEGPVVAQIQHAFMDNWMQTRGRIVVGNGYFPELPAAGNKLCQVFNSSAAEGADSARVMFLLSIASARRSLRIANAYFVPDNLVIETIADAARRGVKVEIITPSERTDETVVRLVGRERRGPLLEAGVRFHEFQPSMFHCKYMIVDDCWVSAGSANFDTRSFRLNDEANLNVHDRGFAAEHVRVFEADKARSEEITFARWKRRSFRERAIGKAAGLLRVQM
jgi:cardiolipin synthase